MDLQLNQRAAAWCRTLSTSEATRLQVDFHTAKCGTGLFDFGVHAPGCLEAGILLAKICLAGLAEVELLSADTNAGARSTVRVATQHPIAACLASQYAGWEINIHNYFAMGSGPMRAAAAREPLFETLGYRETASHCVGVLEASQLPPDEVCRTLAQKCGVAPSQLTLLVAPANSLAGTVQIVARSVETALHKLHTLGFELTRVVSGHGTAPLPPVAADTLTAMGRANDAILYGGEVELNVRGDDLAIQRVGPQTPSCASSDFGRPFAQVLADYDHDFYRIDPLLFAPAKITFHNRDTGNVFTFGQPVAEILEASFSS